MSARVEIVIDRLVVHGLDRAAAAEVERDLRDGLAEVATAWAGPDADTPPAGHRRPRGPVTVAADPGTSPGAQVAEAVATAVREPIDDAGPAGQEVAP